LVVSASSKDHILRQPLAAGVLNAKMVMNEQARVKEKTDQDCGGCAYGKYGFLKKHI
jgi:hypothetical protein